MQKGDGLALALASRFCDGDAMRCDSDGRWQAKPACASSFAQWLRLSSCVRRLPRATAPISKRLGPRASVSHLPPVVSLYRTVPSVSPVARCSRPTVRRAETPKYHCAAIHPSSRFHRCFRYCSLPAHAARLTTNTTTIARLGACHTPSLNPFNTNHRRHLPAQWHPITTTSATSLPCNQTAQ